jgi:hypothetical protein
MPLHRTYAVVLAASLASIFQFLFSFAALRTPLHTPSPPAPLVVFIPYNGSHTTLLCETLKVGPRSHMNCTCECFVCHGASIVPRLLTDLSLILQPGIGRTPKIMARPS